MVHAPRFLIVESESRKAREKRRESTGRSSGESFIEAVRTIVPDGSCDLVRPVEENGASQSGDLAQYDAICLTGSPLHVYKDTPEVRQQVEFMRAVFASATPSFGSCAGLQVAVAAAGGTVRENRNGREAGIARRIVATPAGRCHPLLAGRPEAFDAAAVHSDEVEHLPESGATLLATNEVTRVQAAEVCCGPGVFWGVQYHPELPLAEIASALRRQAGDLVKQGLARSEGDVEEHASLLEAIDREPDRRDLAWRLGVNGQVADPWLRQAELRNFVEHLVGPTMSKRSRA